MKTICFTEAPLHMMEAVLAGQKTMARRLVPESHIVAFKKYRKKHPGSTMEMGRFLIRNGYPKFVVGEVVAIAESYAKLRLSPNLMHVPKGCTEPVKISTQAGWKNKLYVAAEYMRHHIRITEVRVERLQDITDEDIIREGVYHIKHDSALDLDYYGTSRKNMTPLGHSLRHAYATFIGKLERERTWGDNPWTYVYGFELID